jgi:hypothetical protein
VLVGPSIVIEPPVAGAHAIGFKVSEERSPATDEDPSAGIPDLGHLAGTRLLSYGDARFLVFGFAERVGRGGT